MNYLLVYIILYTYPLPALAPSFLPLTPLSYLFRTSMRYCPFSSRLSTFRFYNILHLHTFLNWLCSPFSCQCNRPWPRCGCDIVLFSICFVSQHYIIQFNTYMYVYRTWFTLPVDIETVV